MALNRDGNVCCIDGGKKDLVNCDESGSGDLVDLLPNDPFGMGGGAGLPGDLLGRDDSKRLPSDPFDMDSSMEATFAAITSWIEDYGFKNCGVEIAEALHGDDVDDEGFYTEWNFIWASFMCEDEKEESDILSAVATIDSEDSLYDGDLSSDDVEELTCFGCEDSSDSGGEPPADALFFALGYLGVEDLFSVERVCKSFRDAVRNDPLLWRNIDIDYPFSEKITDERLILLTDRAQGTLCSLTLVRCLGITFAGLKHVLDQNLKLTKLSIPGCITIKPQQLLHQLKVFNSIGSPGIKQLRMAGLFVITNELLQEFKLLLGEDKDQKPNNHKPRFSHYGEIILPLDDEHAIDVDLCPKCQQVRPVYDCPVESCQVKPPAMQTCRACIYCIPRCMNCGRCLENTDYVETFCLDLHCLGCVEHLLHCQDRLSFSASSSIREKTTYHFYLCR